MIRILSVVSYKVFPPVFGGQKGIALFSEYLAAHFPLLCLCAKNNDDLASGNLRVLPRLPESKLQYIDPFTISKIIRTAKQERITHLIIEHPYHGIAGWLCRIFTGTKLIIHSHNIEYLRFREQGRWWWRILKAYERWVHRKADLNLFKTEDDLKTGIQKFGLNPGKCVVMPYGITIPTAPISEDSRSMIATRHAIEPGEKILLFAATLDYDPNAKAMEDIYLHLEPLLKFPHKIIICGRIRFESFQYLRSLSSPNIIYAGEVPDIGEYYLAADVFINPVTHGGGTQTKTIEALANGCNVVCFDHMLEGVPVESVKGKIFVSRENDWNDFADQTRWATTVRTATPQSFFDILSWEKLVDKVADRIHQL